MAAASTNLLLKEVEDITECPICTDRFCNPKMLPCCHMFCLKCIEQYGEDKKEGEALPCPMCRREFKVPTGRFSKLKTNFFIERLISVQSVSSANIEVNCDVCINARRNGKMNAVSFCMTCRENLCDECCRIHQSMKMTKGHRLSPVGEVSKAMRKKLEKSFCKKHLTKELEFYCEVCKVPLCATCSIINHNSHKMCKIGDAAETFKRDFWKYSKNVCEIMRNIEERSDKANEQVESFTQTIEILKSGIIERGENIKRMIDKQTNELLEDLNFHKTSILEKIEEDKEGLRRNMMVCDNFKQFCTKVVTEADSVEVVRVADEVKPTVEEVKMMSLPEPKTLPGIKFVQFDLDIKTKHRNIVGRFSRKYEINLYSLLDDTNKTLKNQFSGHAANNLFGPLAKGLRLLFLYGRHLVGASAPRAPPPPPTTSPRSWDQRGPRYATEIEKKWLLRYQAWITEESSAIKETKVTKTKNN